MSEQRVWSPAWLELSGLPEWLNARVRQGAWPVFKKLVEADCEVNYRPAPFEMPVSELARRTGQKVEVVGRILAGLRRKRLISCFIPEHPDENLLCRITTPLPLPEPRDVVLAHLPRAMQRDELRYLDQVALSDEAEALLREVVDGYLNNVSQKMNPMILDELRLVAVRFPRDRIRKMFARARHAGVDSLTWVTRELIREESRGQKTDNR
jgi:hypothetical protein